MKWTYCKDKMPPVSADVLFCAKNDFGHREVFIGYYDDGWFNVYDDIIELPVYAWQPWPDPAPLPEEAVG